MPRVLLDTEFIDVAHIVDVDAVIVHQPFFTDIDRTNADLTDFLGLDGGFTAAQLRQCIRP